MNDEASEVHESRKSTGERRISLAELLDVLSGGFDLGAAGEAGAESRCTPETRRQR